MKSGLGMYAMFAAMASMGNNGFYEDESYRELTAMEREELQAIAERKRIELLKQRGVNEYFYGANVVYARNQKNADRKAKTKGYL